MKEQFTTKKILAGILALVILIGSTVAGLSVVSAEDVANEVYPIVFAKLDGSEYPIVSPGLGTTASETTVDRYLNFTESGKVKNRLHIARTNAKVYKDNPVDFSGADILSFELTIEDNGAWDYYKDYIQILLVSGSNSIYFSDSDVLEGLSVVVPGQTQTVEFNLNNLDKTKLTAVKQVSFFVKGSTCEINLGIKIENVEISVDGNKPSGDEDEETNNVVFAKLDGTEGTDTVSPNQGRNTNKVVNHSINFTTKGTTKSAVYINRDKAYPAAPTVDLSQMDVLSFDLTVEDNGAWDYYKDYMQIRLLNTANEKIYIYATDVLEGISGVTPGNTQKVEFSLNGLDKTKLTAVKQISVMFSGSTCDIDLKIKITDIQAKVSEDDKDENEPSGDGDEENDDKTPQNQVIAKLDGTEWPICHPGLSGQFNNPNYDAMNFDRYFSGIPSGDVRVFANVTRKAAKKSPIDATKHNLFTFDIVVEDNGSWDTYKDGMLIKLKTLNNGDITFSKSAVKEAIENVVPGEKCRIVLSLASIGKKNLSQVDGFYFGIGETISEKILHVKITNACVEYSAEYPAVSDEPVLDDESEKTSSVIFAKLDGTEWPIVHPGLSGKISGSADYDTRNFDRHINFVENGDIKNRVNVVRTEVYKNNPADFTNCNVLSFNILVEDNGAWADYKDKIKISITSTDNVAHPLASADIAKALSNVVPGEWCNISISLAGLHKGELKNIKTVGFTLEEGSSDKNLHLRVLRIMGEYNENFKSVPEEPSNNDPTLILNDEYGEYGWPASVTSDITKFGNKSYAATTYVNKTKGNNEGWLIRMGFMGSVTLNRPLNIKETTADATKGAIRFWIYAENAEEVRKRAASGAGSYCRYGSTGSWDTNLLEWRGWANQIIYDGWNEIVLPFELATKRGEPDLTNMKSFGLQFGGGKLADVPKTKVYIDDIRISKNTKSSLPISYEPTISGAKMFQPFDETTGLSAETKMSSFGLDLKEKTQGMSSLKFATEIGRFVWIYRAKNNTVDATGYNAVEFDIYVSHPEFFEYAGGTVELTSSGTWDQNEISWNLNKTKLNKGWNHVVLSFDFANASKDFKGNRDIDLSAINFMRFYSNGSDNYIGQEVVFRIDNMCFSKNGEIKVEESIITTNDTGYELYLTAKPDIIPKYGEIVVEKNDVNTLPKAVRSKIECDKNAIIITPTYYKDSIEYLFNDTVTVHLSQKNLTGLKNKYLYRLDVNGSFRKLSRVDNKSKNELVWDEPTRLATYIISDVLIEDVDVLEIEKQLSGNLENNGISIPLIIGISVTALVVLIAGITATVIIIRRRKTKTNI